MGEVKVLGGSPFQQAQREPMTSELITIPDDVKQGDVLTIFLDHFMLIPVRDNKGQAAQMPAYPMIENASYRGQNETTIMFRTEADSVLGHAGEKLLPKKKVAGIARTGGIDLAPPGSRIIPT